MGPINAILFLDQIQNKFVKKIFCFDCLLCTRHCSENWNKIIEKIDTNCYYVVFTKKK
jgi:hypothetical protein